jgi:hypothetical protein
LESYAKEELDETLYIIESTISKCERMQLKFAKGTSQYTLLENRIKSLKISKSLMTGEGTLGKFSKQELIDALTPISSIISKCEKAQEKHSEGTAHYTRLKKIIKAMYISKALITDEIGKRG